MKNITYICSQCAALKRLPFDYNERRAKEHCDKPMVFISDVQAYVATRLTIPDRIQWLINGAFILKGPSKRKKWKAAISEQEIEESIKQKALHRPKKYINYEDAVYQTFLTIADPYIKNNDKLLTFLSNKHASKYICYILFFASPNFRSDLIKHIEKYDLDHIPKIYLKELISFLISIARFRDEKIEIELKELWRAKHLDSVSNYVVNAKRQFSFSPLASNAFSLMHYALKCGVPINQSTT